MRWGRQRLQRHHMFGVKRRFFPCSHSACLREPSSPLRGTFPSWEGKANSRSFGQTCASNECAFAESWRDVLYKYAAIRVLTQCTTSLKAGMSDRAPLCFPHLSFIRLEPYPARFARHLPHARKAFRFFPLEMHFPTLFHTASALSAPMWYLPRGADDTRETCHRRPSGIARFILRRSRHHNPEP